MNRITLTPVLLATLVGCGGGATGAPGAAGGAAGAGEAGGPIGHLSTTAAFDASSWMAGFGDEVSLADLTIPGSHESAALYEPVAGTARCQSLGIADQLRIGVRYLDVRVRQYGNAFVIHHGSVYQHANFDDVLTACVGFLQANPTETILMEVSPTYTSVGSDESNEQTFLRYAEAPAYRPYWWRGTALPTLGAARGKIVLVRRFAGSAARAGGVDVTGWQDNAGFTLQDGAGAPIVVQDFYKVKAGTNGNKWGAIEAQLTAAAATPGRTWFVNFTSGYQSILGIPSITSVSKDVNGRLEAFFSSAPRGAARYGTIVADFVDAALTRAILSAQRDDVVRSFQLVNRASGLCLDVTEVRMASDTPLQQWPCNGGAWQRWSHEPATGLLRSRQDPAFCVDTVGGDATDDTLPLKLWECGGSDNQRFDVDEAGGVVSLRVAPSHVLDGFGTSAGSPTILWTDWGGSNQRWDVVH